MSLNIAEWAPKISMDQGGEQHPIPIEVIAAPLRNELRHRLGGVDHVEDADAVVIPHIEPQRSAEPGRGNAG
jgi:hypothetical protein